MVNRDKSIDILRAIALIGIFFAHVQSPNWIMQLRSFDVPLMALLMGTSFYLSNQNKKIKYIDYVKKRVIRLAQPTWFFLTIFFVLIIFISVVLNREYPFSIGQIVRSYLLLDGIGYVWVIGVFLGVALLNPFILSVSKSINSNLIYFIGLVVVYVGYLGLVTLQKYFDGALSLLYEHVILYTVSYGIIAAIGIRLKKLNRYEMIVVAGISFAVFFAMGINNNFALTSTAKYPPTTYFISYGIGMIFLLKMFLDIPIVFKIFDNNFVYFISKNSMWIYLWHIIPVYGLGILSDLVPILNNNFIVQFLLVFVFALLATWIQNIMITKLNTIKN